VIFPAGAARGCGVVLVASGFSGGRLLFCSGLVMSPCWWGSPWLGASSAYCPRLPHIMRGRLPGSRAVAAGMCSRGGCGVGADGSAGLILK
jgi:hypothetical protein